MYPYQEYKPKKPRHLKLIIIASIMGVVILLSLIAYFKILNSKQNKTIDYPEKISRSAAQIYDLESRFQIEENIVSQTIQNIDQGTYWDEDILYNHEKPEEEKRSYADENKPIIKHTAPLVEKNERVKYQPKSVKDSKNLKWLNHAISHKNIDFNKPMIAIVIDDLGIDKKRTQAVIDIDVPLTLAFLPYPTQLLEQTTRAKEAGHELIIHMPMEPSNLEDNNPGPNALLVHNENDVNIKNLTESLNKFDGYIGINNHMGSRFTANYDAMGPILEVIKERGLLFLDSRTVGGNVTKKLAGELALSMVTRDVFLDHYSDRARIDESLEKATQLALKKGTAIAIGHPKTHTIAALNDWVSSAEEAGVQIVPLSAVAIKRLNIASSKNLPQETAGTSQKTNSNQTPIIWE